MLCELKKSLNSTEIKVKFSVIVINLDPPQESGLRTSAILIYFQTQVSN